MNVNFLDYSSGDRSGPLSRILASGGLRAVFQPIVSMADGSIYAHEALIRGPVDLPLQSPDLLIVAARKEGLLIDFEVACIATQLGQWAARRVPGRLFLNISASTLVQVVERQGAPRMAARIAELGVRPSMLVLEITEHEQVADIERLRESVQQVHAAGIALALDDFGDGRSSLRLWSELAPDIVKIDKYFTRDLAQHDKKVRTLRALLQIAETFGTRLVAEGIETADDLRVVRDLGLALGQGYLLGRPAPEPRHQPLDDALEVIRARRVAVMPQSRSAPSPTRLRELSVVPAEPVDPGMHNEQVAELFREHPAWHALAVVRDGRPVGLIARQQFMERYSKPFFKEIFGRKPCVETANLSPRLVDKDQDVGELLEILTSQDQRYLTEGFIVTEQGRYLGMGTSEQLVRNVTEARIEAARHANPLTFLPGNIPISEHIDRLLATGADFVACYADLSDFKPFNDLYGYWQGDEVIKLVARILTQHADPCCDFVGHVGGDDFVILFQSSDWEQRCGRMVDTFAQQVVELYDEQARAARGIRVEDRYGVQRFFGFTALYMGSVRVGNGQYRTADQVAGAAAKAKQGAKRAGRDRLETREPRAGSTSSARTAGEQVPAVSAPERAPPQACSP